MANAFTPGLQLARRFYADVVRPLLEEISPGLRHSAALLGPGSEVLGFDTARSTDHDWGPRLQIFLPSSGTAGDETRIAGALAERLPASFDRYPTRFPLSGEPPSAARHHVVVAELGRWLHDSSVSTRSARSALSTGSLRLLSGWRRSPAARSSTMV